ncbi:hypothetical protein RYX36_031956 [Vicia faba]
MDNEIEDKDSETSKNDECDKELPEETEETATTTSASVVVWTGLWWWWWNGGAVVCTVQLWLLVICHAI